MTVGHLTAKGTDGFEHFRRLGYCPDLPDDRDLHFAKLATTLGAAVPSSVGRLEMGPVLNQGNLGSCVAHGVVQAIFASHMKQLVDGGMTLEQALEVCQLASRLAIYYLARATHHMQHFDTGTYIRAAFMILNVFGFAPESLWTYGDRRGAGAKFTKMPPTKIFQRGIDQTGNDADYFRIFETGDARCDAVKKAIANGYAVVCGLDVDERFLEGNLDVWDGPSSTVRGGHCVVLGSYNGTGPELKNSWAMWSEDGWARFTWRAVRDHLRDLWVVRHAPSYT